MKILIEESVLRQALETFTHCYAETDRRINERAKLLVELRTALDAAEKVEPVAWIDWDYGENDEQFAFTIAKGCGIPVYRHPAPAIPEGWKGCGECDCEFPCYEGRTRCIRLAAAPEPKP